MKFLNGSAFIFSCVLLFASCSDTGKNNESAENQASDSCRSMVVDSSIVLTWTAFKTTEKIGVSGTFDVVQINGLNKAETVSDILKNATFEIPVSSVNSSNPDRDSKIFVHFFSNMINTGLLSGQVLSINNESCQVGLVMNNVIDTLNFGIQSSEESFKLSGYVDLAKWNALGSVDALNKVCYDLHKGADGVSKLWPDVKLEISANLVPDCK